jgi:2-amino-4-hydroxy-6-hydroxymethyldihydropteridine diphosphokinase
VPVAYLGLGSNLGERLATLQAAVERLERPGIVVVRSSRVYESAPVGGPPQPDFLNAVIEARTDLPPRELLRASHAVEAALGRERSIRWGPRTLDIDILTYGDLSIDEPDLVVPHPRMHRRAFVLLPLLELVGDPPLPGGIRVGDVRVGPDMLGGVRPVAPPLSVGADDVR